MEIYLVGGAVRDQLLGLPIKDKDYLVVGATPELMLAQGYQQVGKDFPVFLHPKTKAEYALARTERKSGHGYTGFVCDFSPEISLEQDLIRRDLTINAMAIDDKGQLHDPYAGQLDLTQRLLRHVSPAFSEDPLRILRVARFAARLAPLQFTVAEETMSLMQQMVAQHEVAHLTPERVWAEIQQALTAATPRVFFEVLEQCQALAVLYPTLTESWQAQPSNRQACYQALEQACLISTSPAVRFACFTYPLYQKLSEPLPAIKQFAAQYRLPNEYLLAMQIAQQNIAALATLPTQTPVAILALLDRLDVWRKPEHLALLAELASATSSSLSSTKIERSIELLQQSYQDCAKINVQQIIKLGFQGKEIKNQLIEQKLQVIDLIQRRFNADKK